MSALKTLIVVLVCLFLTGSAATMINAQAYGNESSHIVSTERADKKICMTYGEWGRLRLKMTKQEVIELLDGYGNPGDYQNLRWYRICDRPSVHKRAYLVYRKGRLQDTMIIQVRPGHFIKR